MFRKTKQYIQNNALTIGLVAGSVATYTVMRKFDLDVAALRKMTYEQGYEAAQEVAMLEYDVGQMYRFIESKGALEDLAEFTGWELLADGTLKVA